MSRRLLKDLEFAAGEVRRRMIDRLKLAGHRSETLAAMAMVPRHRLVPEFWAHRSGVGLVDRRLVGEDDNALEFLYDETAAVGIQDPIAIGWRSAIRWQEVVA